MAGLQGRSVILTAARKAEEIRLIIEKQGGTTILRPTQITTIVHDKTLDNEMEMLLSNSYDWLVLTTGIGTEYLVESARRLHKEQTFLQLVRNTPIAARGHKTVTALKTLGVTPCIVSSDGTTIGLEDALSEVDFRKQSVAVQLYGGSRPTLIPWLMAKGAFVLSLQPYDYECANDNEMDSLLSDLLHRRGDAIAFTSASQVHFLMSYAKKREVLEEVVSALRDVVPAAVGKVTAAALHDEGVTNVVVPEQERMGGMIVALSKYFQDKSLSS